MSKNPVSGILYSKHLHGGIVVVDVDVEVDVVVVGGAVVVDVEVDVVVVGGCGYLFSSCRC